jgi:hypothetical protein
MLLICPCLHLHSIPRQQCEMTRPRRVAKDRHAWPVVWVRIDRHRTRARNQRLKAPASCRAQGLNRVAFGANPRPPCRGATPPRGAPASTCGRDRRSETRALSRAGRTTFAGEEGERPSPVGMQPSRRFVTESIARRLRPAVRSVAVPFKACQIPIAPRPAHSEGLLCPRPLSPAPARSSATGTLGNDPPALTASPGCAPPDRKTTI